MADVSDAVIHTWMHRGHANRLHLSVTRNAERSTTRLISTLDNVVKIIDVPDNGPGEHTRLRWCCSPTPPVSGPRQAFTAHVRVPLQQALQPCNKTSATITLMPLTNSSVRVAHTLAVVETELDEHASDVLRAECVGQDRLVSWREEAIVVWDVGVVAEADEATGEPDAPMLGGKVAGVTEVTLPNGKVALAAWGGPAGSPQIELWDVDRRKRIGVANGHT